MPEFRVGLLLFKWGADGVLVATGASKGIGAKICVDAAKAGWACAVNYASDEAGAQRVVAEIEQTGGQAIAVQADVNSAEDVVGMLKIVDAQLGPLTGLVNNAGTMGSQGRCEDLEAAKSRRLFDVNTLGPFLCSKEPPLRMSKRCGGSGRRERQHLLRRCETWRWRFLYRLCGLEGCCRDLYHRIGQRTGCGRRAREVHKSRSKSDEIMRNWMDTHPEYLESVMARTPLGKPGEDADISNATLFLLS